MWKPLITKGPNLAANKQRAAQTSVTLTPGVEEASMASRVGLPKRFLGLVAGALVVVLGFSGSAASSTNQGLRGTKAFQALKVGSKIFYVQEAGKTALDSDTVIYVKRGSVATGHCLLRFATGVGLCTISDGTGTLAGLNLRVRVTASSSIPKLWHWDGTYSFNRG